MDFNLLKKKYLLISKRVMIVFVGSTKMYRHCINVFRTCAQMQIEEALCLMNHEQEFNRNPRLSIPSFGL